MERANRSMPFALLTTTLPEDDILESICTDNNWECFRSNAANHADVLSAFCEATTGADIIVRLTGDNPLIDPVIIDLCVNEFTFYGGRVDYLSNVERQTFPIGLSVEIFTRDALLSANDNDTEYREHVTLSIRRNPDKYRIINVANDIDYSGKRWTVDTQEDYEYVSRIYNYFGNNKFGWRDIINANL
jgi:spore coat polysaccharide biosynthesis protein SpsF